MSDRYDVAILGGGLAGLTLAIQIKLRRPATRVAVFEKRAGPAPEAAFKVGESTVTLGAWYFAETIGMRQTLRETQLRKAGLRFYLPAGANDDITARVEYGPPDWPAIDTYQLDRGRFENDLARRALTEGVELWHGCRVTEVDLDAEGEGDHTIVFTGPGGGPSRTTAGWVIDASGRASLLKRKLGLARDVPHRINSAWLRLRGGLDIEAWGADDERWMSRLVAPGIRPFATNHLLGEGYWVWLIPLSSGRISIGVCADPRYHPWERISELDALLDWLAEHEPQLAAALEQRPSEIEDFLRIEDYAYGVERMLSENRWALVGEAAAFADPFYSPGSDFIAISNTFASDVAVRDLDGEPVSDRIDYFNDFYLRAFRYTVSKYSDMYPVMGNPWVMSPKLVWDAVNLHIPPMLVMKGKLDDLEFLLSVDGVIDRFFELNMRVQRLFRDWHALEQRPWSGVPALSGPVGPALAIIGSLLGSYDDRQLRAKLAENLSIVEAMAVQIFHKAAAALTANVDPDRPVNPYAIGLDPARWDQDGLHDGTGLTLEQATRLAPGVEFMWLDRAGAPV
jgi:flavin-dependent dehydrogenase